MGIFYLDYTNGNDATTDAPLGWWSVAYTAGTGTAPAAGETVTGATSSSTAKLTVVVAPTSGSWAGGDAAGTMYFYGKSEAFQSETVNGAGGGSFTIASDFTYCAWKTLTSGATAARIAPTDIIRIAKSGGAPASVGTATWSNGSATITLDSAQTTNVDMCETAWTAATGVITVLNATPTNGGTGYTLNDVLTITTGGVGAQCIATGVTGGVVTAVTLLKGGSGTYTTGAGKVTSGGTGAGCTVNITTVANASASRQNSSSYGKEGTYCMSITTPSSCKVGSKLAYFAITPGDLSSRQSLSLMFANYASAITAGMYKICLCSDAIGNVIVDEFPIPAMASTYYAGNFNISKSGGGNLGASTASIAVYSDTATPISSHTFYIDDIVACSSGGLNTASLISTNSAEQGGDEAWFPIMSINGTAVVIDTFGQTHPGQSRGYYGSAGAGANTYCRSTTPTVIVASNTVVSDVMDSGIAGQYLEFQGGFDTSTNQQTGETFWDGVVSQGVGLRLSSKSYCRFNHLSCIRYITAIQLTGATNNLFDTIPLITGNSTGLSLASSSTGNTFSSIANGVYNNAYAISISADANTFTVIGNINSNKNNGIYINGSGNVIGTIASLSRNSTSGISILKNGNTIASIGDANYNGLYGVSFTSTSTSNRIGSVTNINNNTNAGVDESGFVNSIGVISNCNTNPYALYFSSSFLNVVNSITTTGNTIAAFYNNAGENYVRSSTSAEATIASGATALAGASKLFVRNLNGNNTNYIYMDNGTINSLVTDRIGGLGYMYKFSPGSTRKSYYPLELSLGKFAVLTNKQVVFKVYVKKDHATDVACDIVYRGGQILGEPADVSVTKSSDTNWEELTLTLDPTESGVIEFVARAWYVGGVSYCYVENITINQAA